MHIFHVNYWLSRFRSTNLSINAIIHDSPRAHLLWCSYSAHLQPLPQTPVCLRQHTRSTMHVNSTPIMSFSTPSSLRRLFLLRRELGPFTSRTRVACMPPFATLCSGRFCSFWPAIPLVLVEVALGVSGAGMQKRVKSEKDNQRWSGYK